MQAANELLALRNAANPTQGTDLLSDAAHFEDLRQVVQMLSTGQLKTNAMSLLALAEDDYATLLSVTEAWFNRQMAAVEGWYTRQARYIVIALAVVLVFFTGLDTLEIAERLYTAPAVVSAAATSLMNVYRGNQPPDQATVANAAFGILKGADFRQFFHPCLELSSGPCWLPAVHPELQKTNEIRDRAALDMAKVADQAAKDKLTDDRAKVLKINADYRTARTKGDTKATQAAQSNLTGLLKTINADEASAQTASEALTAAQRAVDSYKPYSSHVIGWLVTLLAISLGAPFWFDVINKIVNVRNAGQKPPGQATG